MKIKQKLITKTVDYSAGNALYVNMKTLKIESLPFAITGKSVVADHENVEILPIIRAKYENTERRIISAVVRQVASDKFGMNEIEFRMNGFIATKENIKAHKDGGKIMFRSFPVVTLKVTAFDMESRDMKTLEKYATIDLEKQGISVLQFARDAFETDTFRILDAMISEKEFVKIGMNESTFLEKARRLTKEELENSDEIDDESDETEEEMNGD